MAFPTTFFSEATSTTGHVLVAADPVRADRVIHIRNEDASIDILVSDDVAGNFITVAAGETITITSVGAIYVKSASVTPMVTGWYS